MTDAPFLDWIRRQRSCLTGRYAEWVPELGEWRNPACHVRRAGQAGTAYKPLFSAIPMTNLEHSVQSRNGELACLKEFLAKSVVKKLFEGKTRDEQVLAAKNWFDIQAAKYLEQWKRETPEGRKYAEQQPVDVTV